MLSCFTDYYISGICSSFQANTVCVLNVVTSRTPFKILNSVIILNAVDVVYHRMTFRIWDPCFGDHLMNTFVVPYSVYIRRY